MKKAVKEQTFAAFLYLLVVKTLLISHQWGGSCQFTDKLKYRFFLYFLLHTSPYQHAAEVI